MPRLQIYDARERVLVTLADAVLSPLRWLRRRPAPGAPIRRVLLLRLERIGDLLMVLDAIQDARAAWPAAEIDLVVGSWNEPLARLIPGVTRLHVADAPWLARESGATWRALVAAARAWRARGYDVVLNFEPDIRSNALAWLSGARRRVGYWTGGGGAFMTDAGAYAPMTHVADNARRLVAKASGRTTPSPQPPADEPRLTPPADAIARATAVLGAAARPVVGVHVSGGRESKQWHLDRFATVARRLATDRGATIVLTGSSGDREMVDDVRRQIGGGVPVLDVAGTLDLPSLAALLGRLDVLVTGDTGPMHLAAAMGTPVVALFGPSHVERYGPLARHKRILRVDLPCSPCGQVRLPPERCRGHVPDCMDGVQVEAVTQAVRELLREGAR